MTATSAEVIDAAVRAAADLLADVHPAERRFELRRDLAQELAIKVWRGASLEALHVTARNWLRDWVRKESAARNAERDAAAGARTALQRRSHEWRPTWYPPHRHAREHAPFACEGARVMHVSASPGSFNTYEDALIACIDKRKRNERRRERYACHVPSSEGR